eukprot:jgi/Ulvmu1/12742/UM095_0047.1
MDFGDLELDDDVSPPIGYSESMLTNLSCITRPLEAHALPAGCARSVHSVEETVLGTADASSHEPTRIPGPAGHIQFHVGRKRSGTILDDPAFHSRAWRCASLHATSRVPINSIGTSERIPAIMVVLSELCCSATGNAHILLKDPSGELQGSMLRSCFLLRENLQLGVVLILQDLPVLHVAPGQAFCCISPSNIRDVFTDQHRIGGLADVNSDFNALVQPHLTADTSAQPGPCQPALTVGIQPQTAGKESDLLASLSAAGATRCTMPVHFASSGIPHSAAPGPSAISSQSGTEKRPCSVATLQARDNFRPTPCTPCQHLFLPPGVHTNIQLSRPVQETVQSEQPLSQGSAQPDHASLHVAARSATSLLHIPSQVHGTASQHQRGHISAGNTAGTPSGPQICSQNYGRHTPSSWIANLKQHLHKKQRERGTDVACVNSAPRGPMQPAPGMCTGTAAAPGANIGGMSLAERVRCASKPLPGDRQQDTPGRQAPAGSLQSAPTLGDDPPPKPSQACSGKSASMTIAQQAAHCVPQTSVTGALSHVSAGSRSIALNRSHALLSRIVPSRPVKFSQAGTAAASSPKGSVAAQPVEHQMAHVRQGGLALTSHIEAVPRGETRAVVGQGGGLGRQVLGKRQHVLGSQQHEALEAAGLGFSQSSGDF